MQRRNTYELRLFKYSRNNLFMKNIGFSQLIFNFFGPGPGPGPGPDFGKNCGPGPGTKPGPGKSLLGRANFNVIIHYIQHCKLQLYICNKNINIQWTIIAKFDQKWFNVLCIYPKKRANSIMICNIWYNNKTFPGRI